MFLRVSEKISKNSDYLGHSHYTHYIHLIRRSGAIVPGVGSASPELSRNVTSHSVEGIKSEGVSCTRDISGTIGLNPSEYTYCIEDSQPLHSSLPVESASQRHNDPVANPEQLAILQKGVQAWNHWREDRPRPHVNLNQAPLAGASLSRANLSGAFLMQADLRKSELRGANLEGAILRQARLDGALRADLRHANASRAFLKRADLTGADLSTTIGITQDQISEALGDRDTKLPEGVERPAHWQRVHATR